MAKLMVNAMEETAIPARLQRKLAPPRKRAAATPPNPRSNPQQLTGMPRIGSGAKTSAMMPMTRELIPRAVKGACEGNEPGMVNSP
jgi:hypothetical protein